MSRGIAYLASVAALGSLIMLGWHAFQPVAETSSPITELTLWTAGASTSSSRPRTHVALPDAIHAPEFAERIPDVAFLRRTFPALQRVVIEGDGIEPADIEALKGLEVRWNPPAISALESPELVEVSAPRTLTVGQRLTVQGRARGLPPGGSITLSLEGPDGQLQSNEVRTAPNGEAVFSVVSAAAAIAPGPFEWKLRLGSTSQPLVIGAVVTPPELPRVLIMQASPSVEAGRLQTWLAQAGARVTSRTRVSTERVRFATANESPAEIAVIDAAALGSFDVVVASEAALVALGAGERAAIEEAIRSQGLGLLVTGEPEGDAVARGAFRPNSSRDEPLTVKGTALAPWEFRSIDGHDESDEKRIARLRLRDGTELVEPITVEPMEIIARPAHRWLIRDTQNRTLGAAVQRGRGWVARSLVTDTWRWLQAGHPEIFASYWSDVLSAVVRPTAIREGNWTVENPIYPISVDEPLRLSWIGEPGAGLLEATVQRLGERNEAALTLKLARDPREPGRAQTVFWPVHPGWHEVRALPGGASTAFYVHPAGVLPESRAERRRDTTARLAQNSANWKSDAASSVVPISRKKFASYGWFAVFVVSASLLWLEQRRA